LLLPVFFPSIIPSGDGDLSNYEYVSRQNANFRIVITTGTITEGTTNQVERIIPSGKTAYILKAKVIHDIRIVSGSHDYHGIFDLKIDTAIVDKTHIGSRGQIGGAVNADNANTIDGELGNGIFDVDGADRLVGNGSKKIRCTCKFCDFNYNLFC